MKYILGIFFFGVICSHLHGQILNNEFDNWETIDSSGQPYEDLLDWDTNNEGLGSGFATTPISRLSEGNDKGISISSTYGDVDGVYTGMISQEIRSAQLLNIIYLSKCDSIFDRGACVVNIFDESEQLIYTDSLFTSESVYSLKTIDVSQLSNLLTDLIKVEFVAFGQLGYFEAFQAYADFKLLNVNANYVSSTSNLASQESKVYPNPFSSTISLDIKNESEFKEYKIYSLAGQLMLRGHTSEIATHDLSSGTYLIELVYDYGTTTELIIKP